MLGPPARTEARRAHACRRLCRGDQGHVTGVAPVSGLLVVLATLGPAQQAHAGQGSSGQRPSQSVQCIHPMQHAPDCAAVGGAGKCHPAEARARRRSGAWCAERCRLGVRCQMAAIRAQPTYAPHASHAVRRRRPGHSQHGMKCVWHGGLNVARLAPQSPAAPQHCTAPVQRSAVQWPVRFRACGAP